MFLAAWMKEDTARLLTVGTLSTMTMKRMTPLLSFFLNFFLSYILSLPCLPPVLCYGVRVCMCVYACVFPAEESILASIVDRALRTAPYGRTLSSAAAPTCIDDETQAAYMRLLRLTIFNFFFLFFFSLPFLPTFSPRLVLFLFPLRQGVGGFVFLPFPFPIVNFDSYHPVF